ncbi:RHS repeat-associated core domain-containing protein, partial [Salmonella enterica subsp. salamae serovar 42:b:e,n,x,z15]
SGLHYNRHRYYSPGQGRYITQDPVGLKGGWNLYTYPLNPVTEIDPQGLAPSTFGTIFGPAMAGTFSGVDSVAHLPESERQSTLNDFSKMRGMYNPLSDYVFGWAVGTPVVSLVAIFGPAASAGKVLAGSVVSCLSNVTYQAIENEKINYKDVIWAGLTGGLAPGRTIIENGLIAMGTTYLNKGDTPGAVTGSGIGAVASGLLGKVPFLSNIFGDYATGLVSEGIGDNVEKANSEGSKK